MDNTKKYMVILIIILFIIMTIIAILLVYLNKNREITNEADISVEIEEQVIELDDSDLSYSIYNTMSSFYEYVQQKDNEAVYNMLEKRYITSNQITNQNVFEHIEKQGKLSSITNIYVKDDYLYPIYYMEANIKDNNNIEQKEYIEFHLDKSTTSFEISILEKKEYDNIINNNKKIEDIYQVTRNNYNKFSYYNA